MAPESEAGHTELVCQPMAEEHYADKHLEGHDSTEAETDARCAVANKEL